MAEFADQPQILSVTQLNRYVKGRLDSDPYLGSVAVRGELSNYTKHTSGHHYFTLKDANGVLKCIMYASSVRNLRFVPEVGMQVIAFGYVSVFPRDGRYQLYVDMMASDGVGAVNAAFEHLRARLEKEGLFAPERKKPIPAYPKRIALITSPVGDAVRDMIRILGARWPLAKVEVMGVRVQGDRAPAEMIGALRYANLHQVADLIIIGRGGGPAEDLWSFNDEQLARAICASDIPVISAVGHEPDVTISDYAADLRAATPTHAAQFAVPDQQEVRSALRQLEQRMAHAMQDRLHRQRRDFDRLTASRALGQPLRMVQERREQLDYLQDKLAVGLERNTSVHRRHFAALCAALDSLSPLRVLARGYGLVQQVDGAVIVSAAQAEVGDHISITLGDGRLGCIVTERELNEHGGKEEKL